jgi:hypothetical protein
LQQQLEEAARQHLHQQAKVGAGVVCHTACWARGMGEQGCAVVMCWRRSWAGQALWWMLAACPLHVLLHRRYCWAECALGVPAACCIRPCADTPSAILY